MPRPRRVFTKSEKHIVALVHQTQHDTPVVYASPCEAIARFAHELRCGTARVEMMPRACVRNLTTSARTEDALAREITQSCVCASWTGECNKHIASLDTPNVLYDRVIVRQCNITVPRFESQKCSSTLRLVISLTHANSKANLRRYNNAMILGLATPESALRVRSVEILSMTRSEYEREFNTLERLATILRSRINEATSTRNDILREMVFESASYTQPIRRFVSSDDATAVEALICLSNS
jgi:hypothetical protein